jgi:hypothetical protein
MALQASLAVNDEWYWSKPAVSVPPKASVREAVELMTNLRRTS